MRYQRSLITRLTCTDCFTWTSKTVSRSPSPSDSLFNPTLPVYINSRKSFVKKALTSWLIVRTLTTYFAPSSGVLWVLLLAESSGKDLVKKIGRRSDSRWPQDLGLVRPWNTLRSLGLEPVLWSVRSFLRPVKVLKPYLHNSQCGVVSRWARSPG